MNLLVGIALAVLALVITIALLRNNSSKEMDSNLSSRTKNDKLREMFKQHVDNV